jgi:hypothetical protein
MWRSLPQIPLVVTRSKASVGFKVGLGRDDTAIFFFAFVTDGFHKQFSREFRAS